MKSVLSILVLALLLCAVSAGCRTDPSVAMLQGELRWMEDQIYALEEQYQLKCQELESCRLAHQANIATPTDDEDGQRQPSSRRQTDDDDDDGPRPLQVPQVEGVPGLRSSGVDTPSVLEFSGPGGVQPSSFHMLVDTDVTHILLNRQLTGGYDRDGLPGDDGVMVVIEPRNSSGQFVPLPGEAIIELRDPDQPTPAKQRIARWKLTPQQAHRKMRKSLLGRGVHLELAWPGKPPKADDYELVVTYTAGDTKLTSKREVRIDPPRDPSLRWTPVSDAIAEGEPFDATEGFIVAPRTDDHSAAPEALPAPDNELYQQRTAPLPQNNSIDAAPGWSSGR